MGRKLLVDADVLVYETAFAAQKTRYIYNDQRFDDAEQCQAFCVENNLNYKQLRKDGAITSEVELLPESACRMILKVKLDAISNACGSDNIKLILSGDGNYRDKIAKTRGYKANRNQPKPHHYLFVRHLVLEQGAELTVGIEADDAIGIDMQADPNSVVCSIDKDLIMIPGRHYDWNKGIKYKVEEYQAQRWFLRQLLTGDTVDNIPGIPGMGEKKANALLETSYGNVAAMWKDVLAEYNKGPFKFKDGTSTPKPDEYLLEQGQLLWIQRHKEELWNPIDYTKRYVNGKGK